MQKKNQKPQIHYCSQYANITPCLNNFTNFTWPNTCFEKLMDGVKFMILFYNSIPSKKKKKIITSFAMFPDNIEILKLNYEM